MSLDLITSPLIASDQVTSLTAVVQAIRTGSAITRPELGRVTGLGRSVVNKRVDQAVELGYVLEGDFGPSTGGRAPRTLSFNGRAGCLLVASFGATHVSYGVADLKGDIISREWRLWDITNGPEATMEFLHQALKPLLQDQPEVWGVGIGVPGPVEFRSGQPVSPPIMPGWDRFDIRSDLETRFGAPVWVDNDVNLMALGEYSLSAARTNNMIFVKVGTGVGAGIISLRGVHRGQNGSAGDVGHILVTDNAGQLCRCGRVGCLEAVAGGWALAREAEEIAAAGRSRYLSERASQVRLSTDDIVEGAVKGDPECVRLIVQSGRAVGEHVAAMVNFFNPGKVVLGGSVTRAGDLFFAEIRKVVYERSLPLATRDLQIAAASADPQEGLRGAASLVLNQLYSRDVVDDWIVAGDPRGARQSVYLQDQD